MPRTQLRRLLLVSPLPGVNGKPFPRILLKNPQKQMCRLKEETPRKHAGTTAVTGAEESSPPGARGISARNAACSRRPLRPHGSARLSLVRGHHGEPAVHRLRRGSANPTFSGALPLLTRLGLVGLRGGREARCPARSRAHRPFCTLCPAEPPSQGRVLSVHEGHFIPNHTHPAWSRPVCHACTRVRLYAHLLHSDTREFTVQGTSTM